MKIISFNVGYFLGYDGTHSQYLRHPKKVFRSDPKEDKKNLDDFVDLIQSEDPDVVAAQEIDNGSIRSSFGNQVDYLSEKLEYKISFNSKYSSILANMPLTRNLGNSLIYNEGEVITHRLRAGQKNLVQELKLDGFSLFSVHLATFGQWSRRRQIRNLSNTVKNRDSFVIAGDWNTHN